MVLNMEKFTVPETMKFTEIFTANGEIVEERWFELKTADVFRKSEDDKCGGGGGAVMGIILDTPSSGSSQSEASSPECGDRLKD